MADWRIITLQAENAKKEMILNREYGEELFEQLFKEHGTDGMIFFKRAEAFEILGDKESAQRDFLKAKALFPMTEWKSKAWEGISRTKPE